MKGWDITEQDASVHLALAASGGRVGLRFDPMGGGQFQQAIKQIMEAESQPVRQLEARKSREESRLKLFQEFKTKFASLEKSIADVSSFSKLRELKVDLGDGQNNVSVTVDKEKAQAGSYSIQIDDLAARTSVISNGFEDPDEKILGIGFVVMNLENGDSAEIFVDEEHGSLRGVANAINSRENSPVRASVIKDATDADEPWKLILTAKKEGLQNQIDFPEFYFLDGSSDLYIDDEKESKNAIVSIDGFPIELESNDIPDFLPGMNMHLKQAKPGQPFTITVSEDHQKVAGKVKALVDQMNQVLQFIVQQNTIDAKSDTRNTFAGDSGLQNIEFRLRNLMHEGFPAGNPETGDFRLVHMNQLGIEFDKTGVLTFKEEKFTKALEKDFEGIAQGISGAMGFAFQLRNVVGNYTRPGDGLLSMREQGLRNRVTEIDRQIENKTRHLERRQQSLTEQFSRLQSSLAGMQQQQQYLSAAMGGGGGNVISQLMG